MKDRVAIRVAVSSLSLALLVDVRLQRSSNRKNPTYFDSLAAEKFLVTH
ncbi:hypothetical protein OP10G_2836 [Fimbriimonas ginsengisoli Gsoil 348]|uniref:Uncharacterized protein n=1 Tax=Fimbriimonas ginsengisoli Gsoil 348 TaxID=661478 RepID=A0A068NX54_FIMGI|nr:hypothetical protein OP10G_2836 [Fimbriimonas ginsengisoli Gsoil 348]